MHARSLSQRPCKPTCKQLVRPNSSWPAPAAIILGHNLSNSQSLSSGLPCRIQLQLPNTGHSCHFAQKHASVLSVASAVYPTTSSKSNPHRRSVLSEEQLQKQMQRQVVQVRTLHMVPNHSRPWENGSETSSTCTAFVLDADRRLLITTAGAVEAARKIVVCRVDDETEHPAQVVALCMDSDVAILTVGGMRQGNAIEDDDTSSTQTQLEVGPAGDDDTELLESNEPDEDEFEEEETVTTSRRLGSRSDRRSRSAASRSDEFWHGLISTEWAPELPRLQAPVRVAGFGIGGETLCVTSGVVSRCEVLEYSHSGRSLLGLQVDAPLNNGVWGGPLYDMYGRVLGMAFQKFTSQTWMERYDEDGFDSLGDLGGDLDDEMDDGAAVGGGGGGGSGGHPGHDEDEGVENVGYCIPTLMLQHALQQWDACRSNADEHAQPLNACHLNSAGHQEGHTYHGSVSCYKGCTVLPGPPVLGIRWQALEAPALRHHLGLQPNQAGILVNALDPSGSAVTGLQVGDVLTQLGGKDIANDGTVLLGPGQRVLFGHQASSRQLGEMLPAKVVRKGVLQDVHLRLVSPPPIVPVCLGPSRPLFFIVSGVVFLQLTLPYLYTHEFPRSPKKKLKDWTWGYISVASALEWGLPEVSGGEQVIIMSEILQGSTAAEGYQGELDKCVKRLKSVNGVPVVNMSQLAKLIVQTSDNTTTHQTTSDPHQDEHQDTSQNIPSTSNTSNIGEASAGGDSSETSPSSSGASTSSHQQGGGYLRLELSDGSMMVLDAQQLRKETQEALQYQGIPAAMSSRLRAELSHVLGQPCTWPEEGSKGSKAVVQKRQQRRRLAVRR